MPKQWTRAAFRAADRRFRRGCLIAVDQADTILAAEMVKNVPFRTGDLAHSIGITPAKETDHGAAGAVVVTDVAARMVEFGTVDMSPEPFARPAVHTMAPVMARRMTAVLRNTVNSL